jgi:hypothetical protein
MSATVRRLKTKTAAPADAAVAQLRLALEDLPNLPVDLANRVATLCERHTRSQAGWSFIMVEPNLYHRVVVRLTDGHSKRPLLAVKLWSLLFSKLPADSNEVMATREDLAQELGCQPAAISQVMGELESLGAVYRRREGRGVRYIVHPLFGTHLSGSIRDKAQAEAPALRLVEPA